MYVELPRRNNLQQAVVGRRGYRPLLAQNAASLRAIPATREPVAARSFAFRATLVVPAGPREHRAAQTRTAAAETAPTANAQNAPLVARRWVTSAPAARSSSTLRGRASNLLTSRMAYISGGNQTDPDTRCRGPILLAGTAGSSPQTPKAKAAMRRNRSRRGRGPPTQTASWRSRSTICRARAAITTGGYTQATGFTTSSVSRQEAPPI